MIEIVNIRVVKPCNPYDFYIDRRTPIGNPYQLKQEKHRDKVCDAYEKYFQEMLEYGGSSFEGYLAAMLACHIKYDRLRLFCWCAPKRCHGETVKNWLEDQLIVS